MSRLGQNVGADASPAPAAPPALPDAAPRRPVPPLLLLALAAATCLTLGVGLALKTPCLDHAWDGYQNSHGCYNDIQPLYTLRGFDRDRIPYVEEFNEYPALIGLEQWAAARLTGTAEGFFWATAAFSSVLAVATTLVVADLAAPRRRAWLWALGPPLALYAFHNWDLLAVFLTVLGLWGFRRDLPLVCGAALGLGAAAKLYPALLLPILGAAYLRREGGLHRAGWTFGLAAVAAWGAVNLPFLLANPENWKETYLFHARRTPTYESVWYAIYALAARQGWSEAAAWIFTPALGRLAQGAILAAVGWLSFATWRGRLEPVGAALAALCAFIVLNVFMSVQYLLWVLPFAALLPLSRARVAFLWATDALVYAVLFSFFYFQSLGQGRHLENVLLFAVGLRALALAVAMWTGLRVPTAEPAVPAAAPASA